MQDETFTSGLCLVAMEPVSNYVVLEHTVQAPDQATWQDLMDSALAQGVYLDRSDQGLKPRSVKVEPPIDDNIAEVVQKISRRVIRTLRNLGYLEAGIDVAAA